MTTLPTAREPLEAVAAELDAAVDATGSTGLSVVRGWDAVRWDGADAEALRAAGASWDWVALQLQPASFWDLHVGVLATADDDRPTRLAVGLHWRPALDAVVRPLALQVAAAEAIVFARLSGEHQQELPLPHSSPAGTARAAVDLALSVRGVVTTAAGTPLDARQPDRPPTEGTCS